jgi:hypothetical protein
MNGIFLFLLLTCGFLILACVPIAFVVVSMVLVMSHFKQK